MSESKNDNVKGKIPFAKWYQDDNSVFLTLCIEDCKKPKVIINPDDLIFEGNAGLENTFYKTKIVFFDEIVPENSKYVIHDRDIDFALQKKESSPYWNRLVKCPAKQHWLTINFDKWKDENDSGEESEEEDNIDDPRNGPPPIDFKKHISDNVSKGSSLCPLGSAIMGKAMRLEKDLNDMSEKSDGKAFDINGFDENATDSDDDLLSDLEETADMS